MGSETATAREVLDNAMRLLRDLGFHRANPNHPIWKNYDALPIDGPGIIIDERNAEIERLRGGIRELVEALEGYLKIDERVARGLGTDLTGVPEVDRAKAALANVRKLDVVTHPTEAKNAR